ncbi:hypothetical protein [Alkalimarinus coralli]|uniref:hypothetical protein n=1 Tax=Alkalimarinus coralli TaxID=2935863 RepID=UPI00202B5B9A|nr:hypothetical protein [Alkalimarinus coralli]
MRSFYIALLSLVFAFSSVAQAKDTKDDLTAAGDHFMSLLMKGKTKNAYKEMLATVGGDSERLMQQASEMSTFMTKVREQLGEPISYDLITTGSIKDHFFKQKYLLKFDNAAIIWEINYYQPRKGWKLVDVAYNTDIDALFEK